MFKIENETITSDQLSYVPQENSIRYSFDITTTEGEIEITLDTGVKYVVACKSNLKICVALSYSWYGLTKCYFHIAEEYEGNVPEIIRKERMIDIPHSFVVKGLGETKIISCSGRELKKAYDAHQWMLVREF